MCQGRPRAQQAAGELPRGWGAGSGGAGLAPRRCHLPGWRRASTGNPATTLRQRWGRPHDAGLHMWQVQRDLRLFPEPTHHGVRLCRLLPGQRVGGGAGRPGRAADPNAVVLAERCCVYTGRKAHGFVCLTRQPWLRGLPISSLRGNVLLQYTPGRPPELPHLLR